ncbi:hypothetical protein RB200_09360 [Streptomyces sp. PmtG]
MRRLYGMTSPGGAGQGGRSRRRGQPPQRGAVWRADHVLLRDHFGGGDTADELFGTAAAHAAHHDLAACGAEGAVDRLTGTFPARDAGRDMAGWCAELLAIAGAPCEAPLAGTADDRHARALGEAPASGDDALRRRVDRLLHAVWLYEDRTGPVDPAVTGTWRQLLDRLADEPVPGVEVLTRTAGEWDQRARERQPLAPCACARHIG